MPALRHIEVNVLGYRIVHVRVHEPDRLATASADEWHEVLCPVTGDVLAQFADRRDAERFIIERELEAARVAVFNHERRRPATAPARNGRPAIPPAY